MKYKVPVFHSRVFAFSDAPQSKHRSGNRKDIMENPHGTMLSEDYAEIVDEEGDYSTPASMF